MRTPTFPSRWTRSPSVRRATARRRRARRQRRLPAIGRSRPTMLADGFGGSVCEEPIGAAGSVSASTAFVEFPRLAPLAGPALTECTIEVERANGLRMRVRLQGPSAAEVLALGHWLWSAGR